MHRLQGQLTEATTSLANFERKVELQAIELNGLKQVVEAISGDDPDQSNAECKLFWVCEYLSASVLEIGSVMNLPRN